jgi:hypothetical protein
MMANGERAYADLADKTRRALLALSWEPPSMDGVPQSEQACVHLGLLRFLVAKYIDRLGPAGWPIVDKAAQSAAETWERGALGQVGESAD